MDACNAVEEEVDKILLKFNGIKEHADRVLTDLSNHVQSLKQEMDECEFQAFLTLSYQQTYLSSLYDEILFYLFVLFSLFAQQCCV